MSARGRDRRTDGRPGYPCPAGWGKFRKFRKFRSLSALYQHLDAAHHTPATMMRPTMVGGTPYMPPFLHSPLAWRAAQPSVTPEDWMRSFEFMQAQPAETVASSTPVAMSNAAQEVQFRRLTEIYRQWATYVSIDDMLGAGLSLFPQIPRVYVRALALSLKSWVPDAWMPRWAPIPSPARTPPPKRPICQTSPLRHPRYIEWNLLISLPAAPRDSLQCHRARSVVDPDS